MKRNKKFWTWTAKQKSKRNLNHRWMMWTPGKAFRQSYNAKFKMQDKKAMLDELNGKDGNFVGRTFRNTAKWDCW